MVSEDINLLKKDEQEENPQLATSASAPNRIAPSSSGLAPAQGSGRFTNLQKYISANEGAGQQMTNKLSAATKQDLGSFRQGFDTRTKEVNEGVTNARNLFDTQGEGFKTQLGGYQQGLNTFNNIADRGTFDNTAGQIKAFTGSPQFTQFQNLQKGLGLNEQQLQQSQNLVKKLQQDTLGNLNKKYQDIQTDQGRYNLLAAASPRVGQKSTSGGNRLDQLFFQQDPSAINNLQNTFKTQMDQVQRTGSTLADLDTRLADVTSQEAALQQALNTGATGLQDTFYNKFANQQNYDLVNDARSGLYSDYVNQLKSGTISKDLGELLGIDLSNRGRGILNTWNPNAPINDNPETKFQSPISGGIKGGPDFEPVQVNNRTGVNEFRTYQALADKDNVGNYLKKSEQKANTFQDVLSQQDYDNYQALRLLSNDQTAPKAQGATTLDKAVQRSDVNNLTQNILAADQNFKNLADKNYQGVGAASRSYGGGNFYGNKGRDENGIIAQTNDRYNPQDLNLNTLLNNVVSSDVSAPDTKYSEGAITAQMAQSSLNDYLARNGYISPMLTEEWAGYGDSAANNSARTSAQATAKEQLQTLLDSIISETGVKNVARVDDTLNTLETDRYKALKGLL